MIKYLIAILITATVTHAQTVKNLSYNTTNSTVIYTNANLFFTNNVNFPSLDSESITSRFFEASSEANAVQIYPNQIGFIGSAAAITRTNLGLGATNNVVFGSVNAGSLGTGIRQSGLDGILRFDAATLERARLTPQYQFVLLGSNGNLAFGPDNTNGAAITRTNLGLGATNDVTFGAMTIASGSIQFNGFDSGIVGTNGEYVKVFTPYVSVGTPSGVNFLAGSNGTFFYRPVVITSETNKTLFRENIRLGATNDVSFRSLITSLLLRSPSVESANFFVEDTGGIVFEDLGYTTNFPTINFRSQQASVETRVNLGIANDVLTYWAAKDSADAYIASSVTGGASVTGSYGDGVTALTNPSGRGLPFYRLIIPAVNPRTNSDLAAIRSSFGSQSYFAGPTRTRIEWSENKNIFMRVASPLVGGGTFQFTFGETTTPAFSTNVNGVLPIPSETFIGFSLTRTNTPAQWVPQIISRSSSTAAIVTNTGSPMSTNATPLVNRLQLEFVAGTNPVINLYSLSSSGAKTVLVSQTNTNAFSNATNSHQVNWMMGISPTPPTGTNTVGAMQYDVEPPIIMQ